MEEKIVFNSEDERINIETQKKSEGKYLIRIEDHIVSIKGNEEVREKSLIFSDAEPHEIKPIKVRIEELEARVAQLEGV